MVLKRFLASLSKLCLSCSFIVETTLAGNTYLNLIHEVKALGWITSLTYIGIDDPNTNIQRVIYAVNHFVPRQNRGG
jgi:predicted ABC-type ATPase